MLLEGSSGKEGESIVVISPHPTAGNQAVPLFAQLHLLTLEAGQGERAGRGCSGMGRPESHVK